MNKKQMVAMAEAEIFLIELAEADLPAHKSTGFKSLMADVDRALENAVRIAGDEGQSLVEKVLARRRRYMAWLEKMAGAVATPAKANGGFGDSHIKIVTI